MIQPWPERPRLAGNNFPFLAVFVRIRSTEAWAKARLLAIVRCALLGSVQARRRAAATVVGEHALSTAQAAAIENAADPDQPSPEDFMARAETAAGVRGGDRAPA